MAERQGGKAERPHVPVLLEAVIDGLALKQGGKYIDGTVGAGGHASEILKGTAPDGKLLGMDGDPDAIEIARETLAPFGERAVIVRSNFTKIKNVAAEYGFLPADGVLLDLGLSSMQLANPERGFSFLSETLDMRMDPRTELTAMDIVNTWDEEELADLIYEMSEEHASRKIARWIVGNRPFTNAKELAATVESAVGRHGRIHPATRTFQALRIAVNHELENLEAVLPQLDEVVGNGGRAAIITFHSLEDRMVKNYFKTNENWKNLTKHPVKPTYQQTRENARARSAKLRVAERRSARAQSDED